MKPPELTCRSTVSQHPHRFREHSTAAFTN
uniref:Uncharacterized protein n=1 Tax=Arundo donax TaxID=35708 RepID=A0A0A9DEY2_ARUDO